MRHSNRISTWRLGRAGTLESNPANFTSRSSAFSAAAGALGATTLLVVRDDDGIAGYLLAPETSGAEKAAVHLGHTVAANASRVEDAPDLTGTAVVGELRYEQGSPAARETQSGVDPSEASRRLAVAMSPGQWVAITLRNPSRSERSRHRRWLNARLGTDNPTHHSITTGAVVVAVRAGGASRADVTHLLAQVQAAMPGFDLETKVKVPHRGAWIAGLIGAGLVSWLALWMVVDQVVYASIVGTILAGAGALLASGLVPGGAGMSATDLATGRFAAPARKLTPPRRPKKVKAEDGSTSRTEGDYPLDVGAFMVAANVVTGLVAPQAGALSGSSQTTDRATPTVLSSPIGPLIGHGPDGALVHMSAADFVFGVAVFGKPGSGKSVLIRSLFAWTLLDRLRPSGRQNFPGARSTLVAFESKGQDGASEYLAWGRTLGQEPVLVEVANPATPGIDLFDVPGTVGERAQFFANAMQYAFADGSIQDRSFATLVAVFTGALTVTPALAGTVPELRTDASPTYYANVLLAGYGDTLGSTLAGAIREEAVRLEGAGTPSADLSEARRALAPLYEGKSESARRPFLEAPQNKVAQLLAAEYWWAPGRPKASWASILTSHASVVINTGITSTGEIVEDRLSGQMSALLMYGLRAAIMRNCSGWLSVGRSVSIFADELSLLSGSSPEVITWLRNQGRSYGVRPFLATQYPEQLGDQVRITLMGFSTMVAFAQDNPKVADELAGDFSADGAAWTSTDVVNLPPYTAIVRTAINQRRVTACTVKTTYFEADRSTYATVQGYDDGQVKA